MHTKTLKKLALALTLWLALHTSTLRAQILGPYGSSPTVFVVDSNGLLSATGTEGTGSLSLSGSGTRMFWYPGKAAFRAGYVSSSQWNDASIGAYSVAFGYGTTASGFAAIAFGQGNSAIGHNSTAIGLETSASGNYSTAMGLGTSAGGAVSTAFGYTNSASGNYSTTFGGWNSAIGKYSTASGYYTEASSYDCFVTGIANLNHSSTGAAISSATSWVATDPLFEIGNGGTGGFGNPTQQPSDALVVYKNGNTTISGADNEMPNQGYVNSHSVLTAALGDSRYLMGSSSATTFSLFGGSASGTYSVAIGQDGTASGGGIALGYDSSASNGSVALAGATASGTYATAMGRSTASGYCSLASGRFTTASGYYSTASGYNTQAQAFDSFAIGNNNVGGGNPNSWVATDPLFEIGNGTSSPHDALLVDKSGNLTTSGVIKCQPSTDIPMYNP